MAKDCNYKVKCLSACFYCKNQQLSELCKNQNTFQPQHTITNSTTKMNNITI